LLVTSSLFTNAVTPSPLVASLSHLLERVLRDPVHHLHLLCGCHWSNSHSFVIHTPNTYCTSKIAINSDESFPVDQFHTAKQFRNMWRKKKFRATGSTLDSTRNMQRHILTMKQDRQYTYNMTLRRVHATTAAVEKQ